MIDYDAMSVWCTFTSLGLYPLSSSSTYLLGSPIYDHVTIRRNNGQCTLEIIVHNNSPDNICVEHVLLNNQTLSTFPFVDHIRDFQCSTGNSLVQLAFLCPHHFENQNKLSNSFRSY